MAPSEKDLETADEALRPLASSASSSASTDHSEQSDTSPGAAQAADSLRRPAIAVACALALVGACAAVARGLSARRVESQAARQDLSSTVILQADPAAITTAEPNPLGFVQCSLTLPDTVYETRKPAVSEEPIGGDLEACRTKCFGEPKCSAWSFSDTTCSMFELEQDEVPAQKPKQGAMSGGLPCNGEGLVPPVSFYCFALMIPDGYEKGMLSMQAQQGTSLFACDEYEVYSNKKVNIHNGFKSIKVDVNLKCESGGEFGTALNLDIFLKIWKAVWKKKTWESHDWIVKVDPDAVFFPDRLRTIVSHHPVPPDTAVFLNNCKFGMHGPIEVFSKSAIYSLRDAGDNCKAVFEQQCGGDCKWGEDIWVDQCLEKVLQARRDDEWRLLVEDHCVAPVPFDVNACNTDYVSFHPFKDVTAYQQCMQRAGWVPPNPPIQVGDGSDDEDEDTDDDEDDDDEDEDEDGEEDEAEEDEDQEDQDEEEDEEDDGEDDEGEYEEKEEEEEEEDDDQDKDEEEAEEEEEGDDDEADDEGTTTVDPELRAYAEDDKVFDEYDDGE